MKLQSNWYLLQLQQLLLMFLLFSVFILNTVFLFHMLTPNAVLLFLWLHFTYLFLCYLPNNIKNKIFFSANFTIFQPCIMSASLVAKNNRDRLNALMKHKSRVWAVHDYIVTFYNSNVPVLHISSYLFFFCCCCFKGSKFGIK